MTATLEPVRIARWHLAFLHRLGNIATSLEIDDLEQDMSELVDHRIVNVDSIRNGRRVCKQRVDLQPDSLERFRRSIRGSDRF